MAIGKELRAIGLGVKGKARSRVTPERIAFGECRLPIVSGNFILVFKFILAVFAFGHVFAKPVGDIVSGKMLLNNRLDLRYSLGVNFTRIIL